MTEWVNTEKDYNKTPQKPSNKWTGLLIDPLTSIYDKIITDIEDEYENYSKIFTDNSIFVTDKTELKSKPDSFTEGFEYEIDNTPIYSSPDDSKKEQDQEVVEPDAIEPEVVEPGMTEDKKAELYAKITDIILRIIISLATLFVAYNLYYNITKTGRQFDIHSNLNFMSIGAFYMLTGSMLKTVKFFDDTLTDVIPGFLLKLNYYTTVFGDRTIFIILFMLASSIVGYLKEELTRLYKFLFANKMTWASLYKLVFKSEGNKAVYGLIKSVFIYYYLFNSFSIWDSDAGVSYNIGMSFFKSIGFLLWIIFIIVCFAAVFKPMVSFSAFVFFCMTFFYSLFCISYDIKSFSPSKIINVIRSMSFDMNMNNVIFDPYTDNEFKQIFESGYKGLFKMLPYGIMIYAFAVVIPDILNIDVPVAKWTMLSISILSILGIGVSGLREYFIVNKIMKDVKEAIDDQIEDFKEIDWDGITADQTRLLQHLKKDSEKISLQPQ